jgi:hypothetical protein
MKRNVAWLSLAGLLPFACHSQTWQKIGYDDVSTTSVDVDSIKEVGDVTEIWTLWNYNKPQSVEGGPSFSSIKSKAIIKCATNESADADYMIYSLQGAQGDVVFSSTNDSGFAPVKNGSKAAVVFEYVCSTPPPQGGV